MESIHIVTTSSDSFAIHSAVMIHSLLENLASENEVNIYILHSYMSQQNQLKLKRAVNKFNVELHFLPVNESRYHGCKKGRRMTKEAYYRLSIPELLKQNINKAIYLDSDLNRSCGYHSLMEHRYRPLFFSCSSRPRSTEI